MPLSLEVPLGAEGLEQAQARVEAFLACEGASDRVRYRVRLVLDELAANLSMHGRFAGPPPPFRLAVAAAPGGATLVLDDAAEPFDPRTAPEPAPASIEGEEVGGLGLALVRRMARITAYRRLPEGWNRTELVIAEG